MELHTIIQHFGCGPYFPFPFILEIEKGTTNLLEITDRNFSEEFKGKNIPFPLEIKTVTIDTFSHLRNHRS